MQSWPVAFVSALQSGHAKKNASQSVFQCYSSSSTLWNLIGTSSLSSWSWLNLAALSIWCTYSSTFFFFWASAFLFASSLFLRSSLLSSSSPSGAPSSPTAVLMRYIWTFSAGAGVLTVDWANSNSSLFPATVASLRTYYIWSSFIFSAASLTSASVFDSSPSLFWSFPSSTFLVGNTFMSNKPRVVCFIASLAALVASNLTF